LSGVLSKQSRIKLPASASLPVLLLLSVAYLCAQGPNTNIHFPPFQWLLCPVVGALIPLFADSTTKALNTAAAFVAKYSYGIYLPHTIALWLGCVLLSELPIWLQWSVTSVALCVLTGLGYHYIEAPAIRLGARWASRRPAMAGTLLER
jgi:peptidoglycan/LPS O-acetylase OafA/YrhL